jgi:hypothetical protein
MAARVEEEEVEGEGEGDDEQQGVGERGAAAGAGDLLSQPVDRSRADATIQRLRALQKAAAAKEGARPRRGGGGGGGRAFDERAALRSLEQAQQELAEQREALDMDDAA